MKPGIFYSGTSGLVLPYPNKSFYPAAYRNKSRLTFYGSLYNSIEINSSFYKIPKAATVRRWSESVPSSFKFTFKLWQGITHSPGLAYNPGDLPFFMEAIRPASGKNGCILVQFPPSINLRYSPKVMSLLTDICRANIFKWPVAVEFRNVSWYRDEIYAMLNQQGFGMVLHDKKNSISPVWESEAPFIYLRFHGPEGDYRGSYDDSLLYEYAGYIQKWLTTGRDVYTYFNNTMGDATGNLNTLRKYLTGNETTSDHF